MSNTQSKLVSSLFNTEQTLSSLITQSNKLAKLTGDSCLIGQCLKNVLFICNSEIMVTAFSQIVKGINPSVIIETAPVASYINTNNDEQALNNQAYDVVILILSDSADITKISELSMIDTQTSASKKEPAENNELVDSDNQNHTKTFVIAPQSFRLPNLSQLNADITVSLESNANDIREAFLRGIQGETFEQGFNSDIDKAYSRLTPKQQEVLRYVCLAKSNKEISREMGICDGTVKVHLHTIFRELGVENRIQAARLLGA